MTIETPTAVRAFWFAGDRQRPEWFRKDEAFDASIRTRFGETIEAALHGDFNAWDAQGPQDALAKIIVLDQFTRNAFRGTARAFAGDPIALASSLALIASGQHLTLLPVEQMFVYLPLEHSESMTHQDQSVAGFEALALRDAALADLPTWAHKHREVIARFGRFPHRNALLNRPSTEDELAFLRQPGSSF